MREVPGYLGGYRLLNVVHASRACQIWQASDDGAQRIVAIKAIREQFAKDRELVAGLVGNTPSAERPSIHGSSKSTPLAGNVASLICLWSGVHPPI